MKSNVYKYIQKYKNYDSDFWSSGHGNLEILSMLLKFTDESWISLKDDIANWDLNEIEILSNALCDDESWYYENSIEKNLPERSYLFAHIFATTETDLAFDLLNNFEFVFKGDKKPYSLLEQVKKQFESIKKVESLMIFYSQDRINYLEQILTEAIDV